MRTFGAFWKTDGTQVYGEVQGDEVRGLKQPFWLGLEESGENSSRHDLQIEVPVAPSKLMAVGLNYADHIAEMKRTPLGTPLIWFKAPTSLLPHEGTIEIAFPEHKTDFEVELAIVIGKRTKNVSFVSELPITLRQNGEVKQQARTSQMIYPVAEIVSFASRSLTLLPGDLIMSGTPSGVGPIKDGDELEARIGDWPPLRNRVAQAART